ncbi:MAG: hypothetical protein ACLFPQ_00210 [Candidatus Woesearchaeota archaeon]
MNTPNKKIVEILIETIIDVGGRVTSRDYITMVLKTIVDKTSSDYPLLKNIKITSSSYSSSSSALRISRNIDKEDPKVLGKALQKIIDQIAGPCSGKGGKNEFLIMLKGYIGENNTIVLSNMGIKL